MLDLTTLIQAGEGVLALVITGLLTAYVPKALAAFQAHTGVVLTENQRQTVLGAAQTAAGTLETMLDQGLAQVAHITVSNPAVLLQAQKGIDAVPTAAKALGVSVPSMARIIVGMVDTAAHQPPAAVATAPVPSIPPVPTN